VGEGWEGGKFIIKKSDLTYFLFLLPFPSPPRGKGFHYSPSPVGEGWEGGKLIIKKVRYYLFSVFIPFPVSPKGRAER